MKKDQTVLLVVMIILAFSLFVPSVHGYTISLTRHYVEHYASATIMTPYGGITEMSSRRPYAQAEVVDRPTGFYALNDRGFRDDIIQNNYLFDQNIAWSEAAISVYGESRYNISEGFGQLAFGTALSKVRYDFSLIPEYGSVAATPVLFEIRDYQNTYPGEMALQFITLRDKDDNRLFAWEGENGLQQNAVILNPFEEYSIWVISHGAFSSLYGGSGELAFDSSLEMLIRSQEDMGIPLPPSFLLLGASLVGVVLFRKKLLLSGH